LIKGDLNNILLIEAALDSEKVSLARRPDFSVEKAFEQFIITSNEIAGRRPVPVTTNSKLSTNDIFVVLKESLGITC